MQAAAVTTQPANSTLWVGRILSALSVLFLLFDGVIKVINIQPVVDASLQLGIPVALAPNIGLLLLACRPFYRSGEKSNAKAYTGEFLPLSNELTDAGDYLFKDLFERTQKDVSNG